MDPSTWTGRTGEALTSLAVDALEKYGKPFVWEASASEAWTSGGDELAECIAQRGRSMVGH